MDMTHPLPARVRILGEPIDLVTPAAVMGFTARRVAGRQKGLVLDHDGYSLALAQRSPAVRAAYARADLVGPGSSAVVTWGRLTTKPLRRGSRAAYRHWRDDFWRLASRHGWRVALLSDTPGIAGRAAHRLATDGQGVEIAAYDDDAGGALDAINDFRPDVLLIDLDAERQAGWIRDCYGALDCGVVLTAQGGFVHEAGAERDAQVDLPALVDRWLVAPLSLVPAMSRDVLDAFEARESRANTGIRIY